jgi:hypothetical protein
MDTFALAGFAERKVLVQTRTSSNASEIVMDPKIYVLYCTDGAGEAQRYTRPYFEPFGPYRLRRTTRFQEPLFLDTPPVSRVRAVRTHGLNGGVGSDNEYL